MSESSVLREIEAACMFYRIYPIPHAPKRLYCSVWQMPDEKFHAGVIWRNNVGALRSGKRFIRFGVPGIPDFVGWLFGKGQEGAKLCVLEAKGAQGVLSSDQTEYRNLAKATGVLYGLVRSYDECCKVLEGWGLKSMEAHV